MKGIKKIETGFLMFPTMLVRLLIFVVTFLLVHKCIYTSLRMVP